ncbi:MAG: hypothetical protein WCR45_00625 [Bacteroidaceae bacterium]
MKKELLMEQIEINYLSKDFGEIHVFMDSSEIMEPVKLRYSIA